MEGIDYSWGRPDPQCLHSKGKRFAVRYVSFNTTGKNISAGEARVLTAAGLSIVTNWENKASDQMGGRSAGRAHAGVAVALHEKAGGPPDRPIYFSTDFDASASNLDVCREYWRGAADEIGRDRVGVYGGYRTIAYAANNDIRWLWQTYAWSGGRWHPRANLQQYRNGVVLCGGDVDLDRALTDDFGQWKIGEKVAITNDDVRAIWRTDGMIDSPRFHVDGTARTEEEIKANPTWSPENTLVSAYENIARARADIADLSTPDAVAFAKALAADPKAVDAIATAVAARVGMIPTAQQIAKATVDDLRERL